MTSNYVMIAFCSALPHFTCLVIVVVLFTVLLPSFLFFFSFFASLRSLPLSLIQCFHSVIFLHSFTSSSCLHSFLFNSCPLVSSTLTLSPLVSFLFTLCSLALVVTPSCPLSLSPFFMFSDFASSYSYDLSCSLRSVPLLFLRSLFHSFHLLSLSFFFFLLHVPLAARRPLFSCLCVVYFFLVT